MPRRPVQRRLRAGTIRRARADDLDAVMALEAAAFAHAGETFHRRQVRGLIASGSAEARVVEGVIGGERRVVGWAVGLIRTHGEKKSGRLYGLGVHPDAQGRGLGRALAVAVIRAMRRRGAGRVYLEVRHDNAPAIALYESLGFVRHASLPDYYARGWHAVRMVRGLRNL